MARTATAIVPKAINPSMMSLATVGIRSPQAHPTVYDCLLTELLKASFIAVHWPGENSSLSAANLIIKTKSRNDT
jgi:hypothetical protein